MNTVPGSLTPYAAKELLTFINSTPAKRSVLLLGPPGIGKSVLVKEAAAEIAGASGRILVEYKRQRLDGIRLEEVYNQPDKYFVFVDLRLTETEPVDLMGRPITISVAGRKQLVYHPPQWAVLLNEVPGILFLDELTNVQRPDVLAAAYKLIQDKAAGFTAFHPDVQVVAAGNSPEESSLANLLPAPLLNRVYRIVVELPRIHQWIRWMSANSRNCDEKIFAYLLRFPDDFCRVPREGETLEGYPTPRSYTFLAQDLVKAVETGLDRSAIRALCLAALGNEVGEKVFAFWQNPVPSYEEMLDDPAIFNGLGLDQRYIAVVVIGQGLTNRVRTVAEKCSSVADIPRARALVRPQALSTIDLLETVAGQSKEYLSLLWFIITNRLDAPWNAALYLELCAHSDIVMEAYAAVGDLLR